MLPYDKERRKEPESCVKEIVKIDNDSKNNIILKKCQKIQTYLLGRSIPKALSTQKSQNFVHREKFHTLRWSVSYFIILNSIRRISFVGFICVPSRATEY